MNLLRTGTTDLLDSIGTAIRALPEEAQGRIWESLSSASIAYQEGKITMDEFVTKLIPANLFTPEEQALLRAHSVLPIVDQN